MRIHLHCSRYSSNSPLDSSSMADSDVDTFTLFLKLPKELQFKIWNYAVPLPGIMQVYCVYPTSTRSPELSQRRCDAEATTPAHLVEFGTDMQASGLLGACRSSREIILKIQNGCIVSVNRKIRFQKEHDVILLQTTHTCCERGKPQILGA